MLEFKKGSDAQFAGMKTKLDANPGTIYRYRNIRLREGYTPNSCNLDMGCTGENKYHMEFDVVVNGPAETEELRRFLTDGMDGTFEELVRAFRTFLAPLSIKEPEVKKPRTGPNQANGSRPEITGMPDEVEDESDKVKALDFERLLKDVQSKVIGHEEQIRNICLRAANHSSKVNPQRPVSNFICGETGCGKTLTAEVLQKGIEEQLGECPLIRINLNEYKDAMAANRLVGSAPGYVGYGDAIVFEPLLHADRAVVLFDEVEKAHGEVLDMLMQIIDRGELKLAAANKGKDVVSFRKSVLIFTSNIPIDKRAVKMGRASDEMIRETLARHFRPEFVARIGYVTYYDAPSARERAEIAASCVSDVAAEYGLHVRLVDYKIIEPLIKSQTDFGSRILKNRAENLYGHLFSQAQQKGIKDVDLLFGRESKQLEIRSYEKEETP